MTVVVLGIDALDPDLVDKNDHSSLTLTAHCRIETILSSAGEPSTHELWPTIITGLPPEEHGLTLDDGVSWDSSFLSTGSQIARYLLPAGLRSQLGAWILDNTDQDAFRTPSTYYEEEGLSTVFDGRDAEAIGIPNYVTDPTETDREHQLRQSLGDLFERNDDAVGGHTSADPHLFYERCLEMSMIRIARVRRALRSRRYELVFGYTSGLDLIGHVTNDLPDLQRRAYDELDEFTGELAKDLRDQDELLLVSDHGLQDGLHTHEAMVAGTDPKMVEAIDSVLDVREAIETGLEGGRHAVNSAAMGDEESPLDSAVGEQLKELGYM